MGLMVSTSGRSADESLALDRTRTWLILPSCAVHKVHIFHSCATTSLTTYRVFGDSASHLSFYGGLPADSATRATPRIFLHPQNVPVRTAHLTSHLSSALPSAQHLELDSYWVHIRQGMLIAICIHVAFGIAGLVMGAPALAWLQVVSVAVYSTCYVLSFRGERNIVTALTWLDLLGHSTVAAAIVGPASGFQFYSWILLPLMFTNPHRDLRSKSMFAVGLSVTYVVIDWGLHQVTPLAQLTHSTVMALRYFNLSSFLLAMTLTAISHAECVIIAENRLRAAADTDTLSGLMNRRRMSDHLQNEVKRASDRHRPLAVLLLDIDHFKVINDEHGHARGDQVIARVGEILRQAVRQHDLAARWGGEEFMVLLPDTGADVAMETAERIRRAIFSTVVRSTSSLLPVSVTIGVAGWREGESLETTIHRADLAMYAGKRSGRNQVVLESETATSERRAG